MCVLGFGLILTLGFGLGFYILGLGSSLHLDCRFGFGCGLCLGFEFGAWSLGLEICVCLLKFCTCLLKFCAYLAGPLEDLDRAAGIKKSILGRGRGYLNIGSRNVTRIRWIAPEQSMSRF